MTTENYPLGRVIPRLPIPIDVEQCRRVPAGPVTFLIEGRSLTTADVNAHRGVAGTENFDDGGPTLHVVGAQDGLEHLRFDCFHHEPHYHYLRHDPVANQVIRYDPVAGGDAVAWAIDCVRARLAEMLEFTGQHALAGAVRTERDSVAAGVDEAAAALLTGT